MTRRWALVGKRSMAFWHFMAEPAWCLKKNKWLRWFHTFTPTCQWSVLYDMFWDYVIIYSSETNIDLESHPLFEKKGHLNQAPLLGSTDLFSGGVLCCVSFEEWVTKTTSNKVTHCVLSWWFKGLPPQKWSSNKTSFLKDLAHIFFYPLENNGQLMINCSFGAKWFGFLGSPYERDSYFWVPDSNPTAPGPKPSTNRYLRETNSLHLKMDGWKTSFGMASLQVLC